MGIRLIGPVNSGAAVGGDGVATANADTKVIEGEILAIYLTYNDSPPAGTTDVIIATDGTAPAPGGVTILTITNAATNAWFYPRTPAQDNVGADVTFDNTNELYVPFAVYDKINVLIQGANADDTVDATFLVRG